MRLKKWAAAPLVVLALSATALMAGRTAEQRPTYPRLGPPWPEPKRPTWIGKGIVSVGSWEPLPWLYRKNWQGYAHNTRSGPLAEAIYRDERTEATVIRLKASGVNMVLSAFHKGFGIANEKATMDEAAAWGKLLHKHGLKMAVYVSSLLIYEDLYGEFPEAKDWHRILFDGTPDTYGNDGYRYRAFFNHPGYIDYMKRVCELAVKAGADMIVFDTVRQTPENHHPLAQQMFREWLRHKYPTDSAWFFRTGLHYRDYVKIPHYPADHVPDTFDQSIAQEYLHFKAESYENYAAEMKSFIQSLNPEVVIAFNAGGITGGNTVWSTNTNLPTLLKWLDAFTTEERDLSEYTQDGRLISKIRDLKIAQQADSIHSCNNWANLPRGNTREVPRDDPRLRFAESMAFNRDWLGLMGSPADMDTLPETGRRYVRFFWNQRELLGKGPTASDVAVLRTFASMAFNNVATQRETMLAEQALIQGQTPFDIIDDSRLQDLSKYKVLVLPDQESLSDSQVAAIRRYVSNGGGVVATADTSIYDDWRREREAFGLRDVLGFDRPGDAGPKPFGQHELGKGRGAYIRELVPRIPVPPRATFDMKYWAPPRNAGQLLQAINWAARGALQWKISAPDFVVPETYYQPQHERYVLHLINYNCWRQPTVNDIRVVLHAADAAKFTKVTAISPDDDTPVSLHAEAAAEGLTFALPKLGIYSIIMIEK